MNTNSSTHQNVGPIDLQKAQQTKAEEDRRQWVASLNVGDEVIVPYSLAAADIIRMKVLFKSNAYLTLLPVGKLNDSKYWVKACLFNGWTIPYCIRLHPPGANLSSSTIR